MILLTIFVSLEQAGLRGLPGHSRPTRSLQDQGQNTIVSNVSRCCVLTLTDPIGKLFFELIQIGVLRLSDRCVKLCVHAHEALEISLDGFVDDALIEYYMKKVKGAGGIDNEQLSTNCELTKNFLCQSVTTFSQIMQKQRD